MNSYFRILLLLAAVVVTADFAFAQANPKPGGAPDLSKSPMVFYWAVGRPGACGPGCSEWIAAEGYFDTGAARRLQTFLAGSRGDKLPIYFHSQGGIQQQALTIGRLLHDRDIIAGVSRTVPEGCVADDESCLMLKRSGKKLPAVLSSVSVCSSACVYALIGAKRRQVPPGARLGVHMAKLVYVRADGQVIARQGEETSQDRSRTARLEAELHGYVHAAGVDARLLEVAAKTPHEQIYWLSRDEIAAFKIDTRVSQETPWVALELQPQPLAAVKFLLETKGGSGNEFRISIAHIACVRGRWLRFAYFRGLASEELPGERQVYVTVGERRVHFPRGRSVSKIDAFDAGKSFDTRFAILPIELFDAVEQRESIDIVETDPRNAKALLRTTRLATAGLADALVAVRRKCQGAS
jgi:hypothetical protein